MDDVIATQKAVNPYGITALRIPGSYKGDMLEALKLWRQADANHTLTVRYTVYMPGFAFRSAEQVDKEIARWGVKQDEGDDFVRIALVENEHRIRQAARNVKRFLSSATSTLDNVIPLSARR